MATTATSAHHRPYYCVCVSVAIFAFGHLVHTRRQFLSLPPHLLITTHHALLNKSHPFVLIPGQHRIAPYCTVLFNTCARIAARPLRHAVFRPRIRLLTIRYTGAPFISTFRIPQLPAVIHSLGCTVRPLLTRPLARSLARQQSIAFHNVSLLVLPPLT
jgi:hypothetical protein